MSLEQGPGGALVTSLGQGKGFSHILRTGSLLVSLEQGPGKGFTPVLRTGAR